MMKRIVTLLAALLASAALAQAPLSGPNFPAVSFTGTGQTSAAMVVYGYGYGTIALTGSISSVTLSVMGSNNGGQAYFPILFAPVLAPNAAGTTQTASTATFYGVNLAGLTNVKFATAGTFNGTGVTAKLTAAVASGPVQFSTPSPSGTSAIPKTGTGTLYASATATPTDGCATWSAGNVGSTGTPCPSGSGSNPTFTSVTAQSIQGQIVPAPTAPSAAITGSGGALLTGQCKYYVRFKTPNGMTEASPISNTAAPGTPSTITVTLPTDPTGISTGTEIYRNICNSNNPIANNWAAEVAAGVTSWVDTVPDNQLIALGPYQLIPSYINQTATNAAHLGPLQGTPMIYGSEINNRPLIGPDITSMYPTPGLPRVGVVNMLTGSTENLSPSVYGGVLDSKTIVVKNVAAAPITLNHANFTNPYSSVGQNISGGGGITYTPSQAYLFSFFVKSQSPIEQDLQLGNSAVVAGANQWAHGWVDSRLRRKWFYCVATTSTNIDCGSQTPTTAYGSGTTAGSIVWETAGHSGFDFATPPEMNYYSLDLYIGGLQVEAVPTTPYGIVIMGDSKTQYSCGTWDIAGCDSWTSIASGLMNVPIYNRGIGGQTCQQIVARYATDAHPIVAAQRAKYVVLECGTNGSANAATEEGYITTFVNAVIADGAYPVIITLQPNDNDRLTPTTAVKRQALNSWIKENCGLTIGATGPATGCPFVIDFSVVDQDLLDPDVIRNDPQWQNAVDGVHPQWDARRAEAEKFANADFWAFPRPSQYQAVVSGVPAVDIPLGTVVVGGSNGTLIGAPSATASHCNQSGTLTTVTSCLNINPLGTAHYIPVF